MVILLVSLLITLAALAEAEVLVILAILKLEEAVAVAHLWPTKTPAVGQVAAERVGPIIWLRMPTTNHPIFTLGQPAEMRGSTWV